MEGKLFIGEEVFHMDLCTVSVTTDELKTALASLVVSFPKNEKVSAEWNACSDKLRFALKGGTRDLSFTPEEVSFLHATLPSAAESRREPSSLQDKLSAFLRNSFAT
jgi:hypothetical protein